MKIGKMTKTEFKRYVERVEEFAAAAMIGVDAVRAGRVTKEQWLRDFGEVCRACCGRCLVTEFPVDSVTSPLGKRAIVGMRGWLSGKAIDVDCVMDEGPYTVQWLESSIPPLWMQEGTYAAKHSFRC